MDLNALDTIKRVNLLMRLLRSEQLFLVESTLTDYVTNNKIDNTELTQYKELLSQVKSIPISLLTEKLDNIRSNFLFRIFEYPCSKQWDHLTSTQNDEIKFCSDCGRNVYRVHNKEEYRKRKQLNHCVALDFQLKEKYQESTSCDLTVEDDIILMGSPATIEDE